VNHYPRHIGDWMVATAHLSEIEECIYSRLIDAYYARESPLPLEIPACCRLVRAFTARARKAVATVLPEFFTAQTDGWHQKRCDAEIARYQERSESAKRSINTRWEKRNTNVHTNVSETNNVRNTNQNQNQNRKPEPPPVPNSEPSVKSVSAGVEKRPTAAPPTAAVWEAYASSYQGRYGVMPVRNASVNGQLASVVARLGAAEAPAVASHYVHHNRARYVTAKHPVSMFLQDCEGLRTEWATGSMVTEQTGRQTDRTATTGQAIRELINEDRVAHGK
jgi:uncharacterized protein YdaU (DUF1376 family)